MSVSRLKALLSYILLLFPSKNIVSRRCALHESVNWVLHATTFWFVEIPETSTISLASRPSRPTSVAAATLSSEIHGTFASYLASPEWLWCNSVETSLKGVAEKNNGIEAGWKYWQKISLRAIHEQWKQMIVLKCTLEQHWNFGDPDPMHRSQRYADRVEGFAQSAINSRFLLRCSNSQYQ